MNTNFYKLNKNRESSKDKYEPVETLKSVITLILFIQLEAICCYGHRNFFTIYKSQSESCEENESYKSDI